MSIKKPDIRFNGRRIVNMFVKLIFLGNELSNYQTRKRPPDKGREPKVLLLEISDPEKIQRILDVLGNG